MKRQLVLGTLIGAFSVAAAVGLSGCAKTPESIPPAYVSHQPYVSWSCEQLSEELQRLNAAYAAAAAQQNQARTEDTVGVILLGLPVASLSGGNVAPQIANLKGCIRAVEQARSANQCDHDVPKAPAIRPQLSEGMSPSERHALLCRCRDRLHHLPPRY